MKTEEAISIIEEVRGWKEQNAAEHDFDIDRIIASAREREAYTEEEVIDAPPTKGEQSHSPDI